MGSHVKIVLNKPRQISKHIWREFADRESHFYSSILINEEKMCLQKKGQFSHPGLKGRCLSTTRGLCVRVPEYAHGLITCFYPCVCLFSDCDNDMYGPDCRLSCKCQNGGVCNRFSGCQCPTGWRGQNCEKSGGCPHIICISFSFVLLCFLLHHLLQCTLIFQLLKSFGLLLPNCFNLLLNCTTL